MTWRESTEARPRAERASFRLSAQGSTGTHNYNTVADWFYYTCVQIPLKLCGTCEVVHTAATSGIWDHDIVILQDPCGTSAWTILAAASFVKARVIL